jgi:hypothetical protein
VASLKGGPVANLELPREIPGSSSRFWDSARGPARAAQQASAGRRIVRFRAREIAGALLLVAQEFFDGSLTDGSGIQVYDLAGNLVESIDGLNFQGGFNVFPVHITINPSRRMGFVNGPDLTTAIQSFSY